MQHATRTRCQGCAAVFGLRPLPADDNGEQTLGETHLRLGVSRSPTMDFNAP